MNENVVIAFLNEKPIARATVPGPTPYVRISARK
jgi:hypothetical protein